jgi:sec-independent protein translocase protein TatA
VIGDILQPTHLIFILVVALLVLGPKRLPEVGRSLGRGIRDFRGALSGMDEDHAAPASPVAPVTPATTSVPVSADQEAAHGYVPVAEATAVNPTPVAQTQTVAVDASAVAAGAEGTVAEGARGPLEAEPQQASAAGLRAD